MKFQKLATKRIAPGYYTFVYKSKTVTLTSVEGFKQWYYQIDGGEAYDWYSTKALAIDAAIDYIDNPKIYGN